MRSRNEPGEPAEGRVESTDEQAPRPKASAAAQAAVNRTLIPTLPYMRVARGLLQVLLDHDVSFSFTRANNR